MFSKNLVTSWAMERWKMDWLSQNWIWIALAIGFFFLMNRMGVSGCGIGGCGMGRSEKSKANDSNARRANEEQVQEPHSAR